MSRIGHIQYIHKYVSNSLNSLCCIVTVGRRLYLRASPLFLFVQQVKAGVQRSIGARCSVKCQELEFEKEKLLLWHCLHLWGFFFYNSDTCGLSNLCVLNVSLGVATETLRWKQALQKLHLVERHVGVEGPQAGSLTVLIPDLQTLDHQPANWNPDQTQVTTQWHFDLTEFPS